MQLADRSFFNGFSQWKCGSLAAPGAFLPEQP